MSTWRAPLAHMSAWPAIALTTNYRRTVYLCCLPISRLVAEVVFAGLWVCCLLEPMPELASLSKCPRCLTQQLSVAMTCPSCGYLPSAALFARQKAQRRRQNLLWAKIALLISPVLVLAFVIASLSMVLRSTFAYREALRLASCPPTFRQSWALGFIPGFLFLSLAGRFRHTVLSFRSSQLL